MRRRAFSLVELLVVLGIIALLLAILVPSLAQARRVARDGVCRSNLRQFGISTATYSIDFRNIICSFSWTTGNLPTEFSDLQNPYGIFDSEANAIQATDIIRRRSPSEPNFPLPTPWNPAVEYTHLVLMDYLAARIPEPMVACPEDRPLLLWQKDIPAFNRGDFGALQPEIAGFEARVMRAKPYSSSYETVPAAYDRTTNPLDRLTQSPISHYAYALNSNTRFGGVRLDNVAYPSVKVHMYDTHQRHHGRALYWAHPDASQPVLQFDSAVVERRTRDAGLGWRPDYPRTSAHTDIHYQPYRHESPTTNGLPEEIFPGRYRWTRGGIRGVDFGPEITNAY